MKKLNLEKKVYCYWNLHDDVWSLMQGGKVVGYANTLRLSDVEFRVRPGGRAKVLAKKRKGVHAFAIGYITEMNGEKPEGFERVVTYRPYERGEFFYTDTEEAAKFTDEAYLETKRILTK